MSLTDLASLGSFISGIAVAASVLYLALQTHQNAKHTRALVQLGRATRIVDLILRLADPDMVAAEIAGNGGTPTPEAVRVQQFQAICRARLIALEDSFAQHEVGLISEDAFGDFRAGIRTVLTQPGARAFWIDWKAQRPRTSMKFKAFVDEMLSSAAATESTLRPPGTGE